MGGMSAREFGNRSFHNHPPATEEELDELPFQMIEMLEGRIRDETEKPRDGGKPNEAWIRSWQKSIAEWKEKLLREHGVVASNTRTLYRRCVETIARLHGKAPKALVEAVGGGSLVIARRMLDEYLERQGLPKTAASWKALESEDMPAIKAHEGRKKSAGVKSDLKNAIATYLNAVHQIMTGPDVKGSMPQETAQKLKQLDGDLRGLYGELAALHEQGKDMAQMQAEGHPLAKAFG